jgi:MtN3 and saliva related transmembrane protein
MPASTLTSLIGIVAALCTTAAFVPQLIKLRRQGGRDLSYGMLVLYLVGMGLWLTYGVRVDALEVIAANAVAGLLVLATIVTKYRSERRSL